MKHHHSFPKSLAAGLAVACVVGAQYACQPDAPGQAEAEEQRDAEHAPGGDGEVHWSYEGETAPDRWGGLDPSFAVCDSGVQQSPIDLAVRFSCSIGGSFCRSSEASDHHPSP